MINALRAESRRLLARRITVMTLLGLLVLVAAYQLQVSSQVAPPSAAEAAAVQRDYDEYVKEWEANHEEWEADCRDDGGTDAECAQPRPSLADWGLAPVPFKDAVTAALSFAIYLGGMLLFVAMASFIGAETSSGSLANWLTFVPHRTTVMMSKLIVVGVFSVAVGAALGLLTVVASVLVTTLHGQPLTGLDAVWAMAARGVVVVAILGIAGFLVGMLTGSTGASIGVLLGGLFVTYLLSVLAFASRWAQPLAPLNPGLNLQAILGGGVSYEIASGPGSPLDEDFDAGYVTKTLTLAYGLGYWAVVLLALVVVTWALFRRRDVT